MRPFAFVAHGRNVEMTGTPTVGDILDLIEQTAPAGLAERWDNPGLQVGYSEQRVHALLAALDPSESAVAEAASRGAQLILTHHPLFFRPVNSLALDSFPGNVVHAAVTGGISLASIHTNLDAARNGISDVLAEMIGLRDVGVLEEGRKEEGVGLGRVGDLVEAETAEAVLERMKTSLGIRHLRMAGAMPASVKRIAVVGGSGGGMIPAAAKAGADVLLTGDVTYHQALDALQRGLMVVDGGHFATEKAAFVHVVRNFASAMARFGWAVEIHTAEEADPFTVL